MSDGDDLTFRNQVEYNFPVRLHLIIETKEGNFVV